MKILLIDDSPNDRLLIRMEIEQEIEGVDITEISTLEDFQKVMSNFDYDIVLTDYLLRWSDGISILKEIKEKYPDIPVIMVTDSGSEEIAVDAMKLGLEDYVLKKKLKKLPIAIQDAISKYRMKVELKESEERYKTITETIPMGVYIIKHGKFEFVNKKFLDIFNLEKDEVIGREFYEILSKGDREICKKCIANIESGPDKVKECEVKLNVKGKDLYLSLFVTPLTYKRKRAVLGLALDITRKKEMERHLIESQKIEAIGSLIGGIAHDFNNLLSIITGYADILELKVIKEKRGLKYVHSIQDAANKAKELIQNLVDFARPSEYETEPLDMVSLIREGYKLSRPLVPENIELRISYPKDRELIVNTNSTLITQIMTNLITNSVHAIGEESGIIEIILEEIILTEEKDVGDINIVPGKYALFKVKDTGKGIPTEIMDKIFDPYFTSKKDMGGKGLGLSMVKKLVSEMGGGIEVESKEGYGTEFRVFFPITEKGDKTDLGDELEQHDFFGSEHIMFVDDEEKVVEVGCEMLEELGYKAVGFTDPQKALEDFTSNPYSVDLVITDMRMPKMDGLELIEKMRQIRKDLPVIVVTGYSDQLKNGSVEKFNLNGLLFKPIGYKDLAKTIKEVFK